MSKCANVFGIKLRNCKDEFPLKAPGNSLFLWGGQQPWAVAISFPCVSLSPHGLSSLLPLTESRTVLAQVPKLSYIWKFPFAINKRQFIQILGIMTQISSGREKFFDFTVLSLWLRMPSCSILRFSQYFSSSTALYPINNILLWIYITGGEKGRG